MGRRLKPLPPSDIKKPQRNVAQQEKRRTFIWNLLLAGADVRTIRGEVGATFHVGKDTIEDDVRLLRAEATAHFEVERMDMLAVTLQQLDRIAVELRQAAQDARRAGQHASRVAALSAASKTLKDKAQIAGLIVDRHEVRGEIATLNLNVDATETIQDIVQAKLKALAPAT